MRNHFLILLVLFISTTANAVDYTKYNWEAGRSRYTLSEKENAFAEYILKNHEQYEYVFEKDEFVMYETTHRIVLVNNSDAIQHFNRIFISMRKAMDLVELKARSINKDGKVVNFDINNLKEVKDEESGKGFRIFAIEGIEVGSEVEYFYTLKKTASIYDRVFLQFATPVKEASFLLSCPKHLKFDCKEYNSKSVVEGKSTGEVNMYVASEKNLPAIDEEGFASFNANRVRVEFKLAYNTAKSNARLYTWDDAAKTFYKSLTTKTKDEEKAVDKFVKTLGDKPSEKLEQRIINIERKLKMTVQINPDAQADNLDQIIKNKLASKEGMMRLFIAVFDKLNIKNEAVITCNRSNFKFDEKFDSWAYLDDYLLYFPDVKGFVAPYYFETRYPVVPAEFTAQKGLFIEPFEVGNVKSGLAVIKEIPALDYKLNTDNLTIKVAFNEDLTSNVVQMKREFGGINATFLTPYYHLMNEEQKAKMVEGILKQTAPDPVITKWDARPLDAAKTSNFLIDVDFISSHFIENAGSRILFKVGELIGPQSELYRDDDRKLNVENDFNRGYDRVIDITIPSGYQVRNPDDLKFNVVYQDKDKQPFLFISEYTLKENQLHIVIQEYYKEIYAPLARYEDYRKVINAAADFNKVTLVLEKK